MIVALCRFWRHPVTKVGDRAANALFAPQLRGMGGKVGKGKWLICADFAYWRRRRRSHFRQRQLQKKNRLW
jgi:hypothetical protein